MSADDDSFAVLGLAPGASAEEVERAYRSAIKRHHPDVGGGDSAKAAEINQAYRTLRAHFARRDIVMRPPIAFPPRLRTRSLWIGALGFVALLAIGSLILLNARDRPAGANLSSSHVDDRKIGEPIHVEVIDRAARATRDLARGRGEPALRRASTACYQALREDPTLIGFDRCVAIDDAAVRLLDRDPMRDKGMFAQIAVTGRQWSAAAPLSDNNFETDARLNAIRARVDFILAGE